MLRRLPSPGAAWSGIHESNRCIGLVEVLVKTISQWSVLMRIGLALGAICLAACACAGNGPTAPAAGAAIQQVMDLPDVTAQALPGVAGLDILFAEDSRSASLAGPGWYDIALDQPNFSSEAANVTPAGNSLDFDGSSGAAWKVWGIGNWESDSSPSSLHAMVSQQSGEYYLAYADFTTGRWSMLGPYTDEAVGEYAVGGPAANPLAYMSSMHRHFVALIVPAGSSLRLDALELGVYGGNQGPAWVMQYQDHSTASQVIFSWIHSASRIAPDFAGYSIERMPFTGGAWQRIDSGLQFVDYFTDPNVLPDTWYRYRVNSWDSNGNMTTGISTIQGALTGSDAAPVVIARLPDGPLNGPVQVTIDLSDSFDPDGTAISSYDFDFGGQPPSVTTPDPVLNLTLQPGCYYMVFFATSNGKTGTAFAQLRVYPQWSDTPVTIATSSPIYPRANSPRAMNNPGQGSSTVFFLDAVQPGLSAVTTDALGNSHWDMLPLIGSGPGSLSELAISGERAVFLVSQSDYGALVQWDGQRLDYLQQIGVSGSTGPVDVASDGDERLWEMLFHFNGVKYDLVLNSVKSGAQEIVVPDLSAPLPFDLEYNPATDSLDILVSGASLTWYRRHPDGSYDTALVSPVQTVGVDMDLDPFTGRPAAVFFQGNQSFYSALNDDLLSWSGPQIVDGVNQTIDDAVLIHKDKKAYIVASDQALGQVRLYRRGNPFWEVVNTDDDQNGGLALSLVRLDGSAGFRQYNQVLGGDLVIKDITTADTETPVDTISRISGNGLHMHAASTDTELHVVQVFGSGIQHFSSPDGVNWTAEATLPFSSLPRLCRDPNDELLLSYRSGGQAFLDRWNGAAFVNVTSLTMTAGVTPMLSGEGIYLFGVDNNTNLPPYMRVYTAAGGAVNNQLDEFPVWDGCPVRYGGNLKTLVFYGGSVVDDARLGVMDLPSHTVEEVNGTSMQFALDPFLRTRTIDGTSFIESEFINIAPCWYVSYGPMLVPARVSSGIFGNLEMESLPLTNILFEPGDIRRTVSVMQTGGATAVGYVADNSGPERYLEWSNFGNWEELPLPEIERMSQGDLATGPDGRWHLFYRDIVTDELRVISTI